MNALNTQATRRAIFGTLGLSVAAATIGTVATAKAPSPGISSDLAKLMRAYDAADAACDSYEADVYQPAFQRFSEAAKAVPHSEFVGGRNMGGKPIRYSTDDNAVVAMARALSAGDRTKLHVQDARRLMAAHGRRVRAINRLRREYNLDNLREGSNRLNDRCAVAVDAVVAFHCATLADLHAKMLFVIKLDAMPSQGTQEALAADIARLAAREA